MPLPNLVKPLFPNVPNLPGVPPLPRSINFPVTVGRPFAVIQDIYAFAFNVQQVWGVFNSGGTLAIQPDTFLAIEFSNDNKVANFPIQEGEFGSYNKVANPYESVIRMAKGGFPADRTAFLLQIENALKSLQLYDIVTPERTYSNANLTRYTYPRTREEGANMLLVDLYFIEIRQVTVQYTTTTTVNAKEPQGKPVSTNGKTAPVTLPAAKQSELSKVWDAVKGAISK